MRNNPLPPNLIHVQAHALCFVQNFFLFLVYWGLFVLIIVDFFFICLLFIYMYFINKSITAYVTS